MDLNLEIPVFGRAGIEMGLAHLTLLDQLFLRVHPETAPLYASGVRYLGDGVGSERWKSIAMVLRDRGGDCKTLAAWRVAELRESGEDPDATWLLQRVGPRSWHVVVVRGSGVLEDPSEILGMRAWNESVRGGRR